MDNILDKRNKLIKQRNVMNLLLFPCWMLSFFISIDSMIRVLPIIEFMSGVFKMDYLDRYMLLSFLEFFYRYLPTMIYIGGRVYIFNLNKKIMGLEQGYDLDGIKENEKRETAKAECVITDEEEVRRVYDIVERFANLSRSKQMEILNYIKGDLELYDKELSYKIDLIGDKYKDHLLTECEDILFPDFDDDKEKYTKKRRK